MAILGFEGLAGGALALGTTHPLALGGAKALALGGGRRAETRPRAGVITAAGLAVLGLHRVTRRTLGASAGHTLTVLAGALGRGVGIGGLTGDEPSAVFGDEARALTAPSTVALVIYGGTPGVVIADGLGASSIGASPRALRGAGAGVAAIIRRPLRAGLAFARAHAAPLAFGGAETATLGHGIGAEAKPTARVGAGARLPVVRFQCVSRFAFDGGATHALTLLAGALGRSVRIGGRTRLHACALHGDLAGRQTGP